MYKYQKRDSSINLIKISNICLLWQLIANTQSGRSPETKQTHPQIHLNAEISFKSLKLKGFHSCSPKQSFFVFALKMLLQHITDYTQNEALFCLSV